MVALDTMDVLEEAVTQSEDSEPTSAGIWHVNKPLFDDDYRLAAVRRFGHLNLYPYEQL